jgi:predicted MFS family arabinose efflux permease
VRQVLLLVFFFFFSGISTIALAAIVGLQWLPSNALAYSFLLSSMGLGAISAVMLLPFLGRKLDTRTLLNVSLTTQGILIMLLSVIRNEMSLYLLFFASGFFWVCVVSILTVTIQMALDNSYRARGMSFYQICIMGGSAAGASAWGTLSTYLSLEAAFLTSGAMLLTSLFIPFSAKQINS